MVLLEKPWALIRFCIAHNNLLHRAATGVIWSLFFLLQLDHGDKRYKQVHHVGWMFVKRHFGSYYGVLQCHLWHSVGDETYPCTQNRSTNGPKTKQNKQKGNEWWPCVRAVWLESCFGQVINPNGLMDNSWPFDCPLFFQPIELWVHLTDASERGQSLMLPAATPDPTAHSSQARPARQRGQKQSGRDTELDKQQKTGEKMRAKNIRLKREKMGRNWRKRQSALLWRHQWIKLFYVH